MSDCNAVNYLNSLSEIEEEFLKTGSLIKEHKPLIAHMGQCYTPPHIMIIKHTGMFTQPMIDEIEKEMGKINQATIIPNNEPIMLNLTPVEHTYIDKPKFSRKSKYKRNLKYQK